MFADDIVFFLHWIIPSILLRASDQLLHTNHWIRGQTVMKSFGNKEVNILILPRVYWDTQLCCISEKKTIVQSLISVCVLNFSNFIEAINNLLYKPRLDLQPKRSKGESVRDFTLCLLARLQTSWVFQSQLSPIAALGNEFWSPHRK